MSEVRVRRRGYSSFFFSAPVAHVPAADAGNNTVPNILQLQYS